SSIALFTESVALWSRAMESPFSCAGTVFLQADEELVVLVREHRRDACCGNPSVLSASNRRCKGGALLHDVAAGLEASGLSAQVICSFAWQGVRRHATVILRRIEASLFDGPDITLITISRLLCVRDSVQRLEYPLAIRPRSHGPYALYGARWLYAAQRLPRPHR